MICGAPCDPDHRPVVEWNNNLPCVGRHPTRSAVDCPMRVPLPQTAVLCPCPDQSGQILLIPELDRAHLRKIRGFRKLPHDLLHAVVGHLGGLGPAPAAILRPWNDNTDGNCGKGSDGEGSGTEHGHIWICILIFQQVMKSLTMQADEV